MVPLLQLGVEVQESKRAYRPDLVGSNNDEVVSQ